MSSEAIGWVWKFSPYSKSEKLVHLAIADSANDMNDNEIWARQSYIAEKAEVSRATVNAWLSKAVTEGFIELLEDNASQGKPNRYRFLMPEVPQRWDPRGGVKTADTLEGGVKGFDRGVSKDLTGGVKGFDTEPKENPTREPNLSEGQVATYHSPPSGSPNCQETLGTTDSNADGTVEEESDGASLGATKGAALPNQINGKGEDGPEEKPPTPARVVFDEWVRIMERDPKRTKLTAERRTKINARLRGGLSVEELIEAIKGARANPWMMGENDRNTVYDDIVTILGNDTKAEKHLEFYRRQVWKKSDLPVKGVGQSGPTKGDQGRSILEKMKADLAKTSA